MHRADATAYGGTRRPRFRRETVRGWDAMYVVLAEAIDEVLLTTDQRLATATDPTCRVKVLG
ncbi:MAG TPA: hypothetical protein VFJ14_14710 [Nocardioidaceae bacterium]|nr:hypothetical protein [Nocardioidaceae bacterium]